MARISSRELTEWLLYFEITAEEADLARDGFSADEIEDAIAHRSGRDWAAGLDRLLSVEQQDEQLRQLLWEEEIANEEEHED